MGYCGNRKYHFTKTKKRKLKLNRSLLVNAIKTRQSFLCVGLDTDIHRIPECLKSESDRVFAFNKQIIDATLDYCISYKINTAFYEALGVKGWEALEKTANYIPDTHFKIADAKRGDIGNTSTQYAKAFFETLPFDAITVSPYMGSDSVQPFLKFENKWVIILGLTSNAGSMDFQKLKVGDQYLYEEVIKKTAGWGNESNTMFVVGATRAEDLSGIRKLIPNHFLLVPGVGAQGGSLADVAQYGLTADGGLLVNASRSIIYAGNGHDFAEKARDAARALCTEMKGYL